MRATLGVKIIRENDEGMKFDGMTMLCKMKRAALGNTLLYVASVLFVNFL